MDINFSFNIQDLVYVKPADVSAPAGHNMPAYKVVSRIYEELNEYGGVISYVVRHVDSSTPGGGKLYKFTEDELINKDAYNTLKEITRQNTPIYEHMGQSSIAIPKASTWAQSKSTTFI